MRQEKTRRWLWIASAVAVIALLLYSAVQLFGDAVFVWERQQEEYREMMKEVFILFGLFFLLFCLFKRTWLRVCSAVLVLSVFSWAHVVFLPAVVSGIYLIYIMAVGRFLRTTVLRLPAADGYGVDFLAGSAGVISVFCAMSATGIGAIRDLIGFVAVSGLALLVWFLFGRQNQRLFAVSGGRGFAKPAGLRGGSFCGWPAAFCLAWILTMFCIQAGRMNIALDFDSLWYGLRSPYILDNGRGIYENMGTIGVVYTYSKGWEVLTLPLSVLPSYSFVTAVNLWMAAGAVILSFRIARCFVAEREALLFITLLSGLPGIMNMAVTAKTDVATLLYQLMMIAFFLTYLQNGRREYRYLFYGMAAYLVSLTLKPTALVFSTAVFGMSMAYFLWTGLLRRGHMSVPRNGGKRNEAKYHPKAANAGSLAVFFLALAALFGIWARTVKITGLPVTSVFSSLLVKLGFQMNYPFNVTKIPNSGQSMPAREWVADVARRVFQFLFRPLGPDMDHVILAWGGYLLVFAVILWIVCALTGKNVEKEKKRQCFVWLRTVYFPFAAVNGISLAMLTQVDGNYFMLFYMLTLLCAFSLLSRVREKWAEIWVRAVSAPVLVFSALVMSLTNWSWTVGFTPVSWEHRGYYDHLEAARRSMEESGNEAIWELVSGDPQTRLIAVGDHPQVLAFPCNVQSYDDITGVWGNVVLVKYMDNFVEFMEYAKTDYVYVQAGYMGTEERCYSLVRDLIEYGKLIPIVYEEGNVLAKVAVGGEYTKTSQAALAKFDRLYPTREGDRTER